MNEFNVLGIVSGVSKKSNKAYFMLHLTRPFTESNTQFRQGHECLTQYVEGTVPPDILVGSVVEFDYTLGSNGYPVVCGVHAV